MEAADPSPVSQGGDAPSGEITGEPNPIDEVALPTKSVIPGEEQEMAPEEEVAFYESGIALDGFGLLRYEDDESDELAQTVVRYTLSNSKGMTVQIINYGVTVTSIYVPDRKGIFDDVVLGFNHFEDYILHRTHYFGNTIGRVANRISAARFQLDGRIHDLSTNLGADCHINGGFQGFSHVIWHSRIEGEKVIFTYLSRDGEEGYPGNLLVTITVWLTADNGLKMVTTATTDQPTPVSISNNTYFNLAGHSTGPKTLEEHVVVVNADKYLAIDDHLIPTGEIKHVGCTLMDLRIHRILYRLIPQIPGGGFDHTFVVNGGRDDGVRFVARMLHPPSGRVIEVFSNQPTVHFYTGRGLPREGEWEEIEQLEPIDETPYEMTAEFGSKPPSTTEQQRTSQTSGSPKRASLAKSEGAKSVTRSDKSNPSDQRQPVEGEEVVPTEEEQQVEEMEKIKKEVIGKSGALYEKYGAFTFQTHGYTDAVNKRQFPDMILRPGETYNNTVVYKFSVVVKTKKYVAEAEDNGPELPEPSPEGSRHSGDSRHSVLTENTFNYSEIQADPEYPPFEGEEAPLRSSSRDNPG